MVWRRVFGLFAAVVAVASCSGDSWLEKVTGSNAYFPDEARKLAGSWQIVTTDSLTGDLDTLWLSMDAGGQQRAKRAYSVAPDLVVRRLVRSVGGPCEVEEWNSIVAFRDEDRIAVELEGPGWQYRGELVRESDREWVGAYRYRFSVHESTGPQRDSVVLPGTWQARKMETVGYAVGELPGCRWGQCTAPRSSAALSAQWVGLSSAPE